jgi:hypothetical protein
MNAAPPIGTMNGLGLLMTYFQIPLAIRRIVFSASGRFRPKIDGHGIDQSMISAAVRHGFSFPDRTSGESGAPCVGSGQTIGRPSQRAIRKNRFRIVGAP